MFLKIVSEISKTPTRPSYRLQVIAVGRHAKNRVYDDARKRTF